jgi:SNF2 family DNA or RNA helicase
VLIRPFLLWRRKTGPGIAPELPRKTGTGQIAALAAEQVTLYEAMVRETVQAIAAAEGIERAGLVFKLLTGLKQICNHPAQYLKQPGPLPGRSGKLDLFDELTDAILAGGEGDAAATTSGVTCAGIRTRVLTATGSLAGCRRPTRLRPSRRCGHRVARACVVFCRLLG